MACRSASGNEASGSARTRDMLARRTRCAQRAELSLWTVVADVARARSGGRSFPRPLVPEGAEPGLTGFERLLGLLQPLGVAARGGRVALGLELGDGLVELRLQPLVARLLRRVRPGPVI